MVALVSGEVKVSVCIISYNHEKYIAQCLDSVLAQECNFSFEVVIRDDFSSDKTLGIVLSYCDRYPDVVKLVDSKLNVGANSNLLKVFENSCGKYIAICEGDDYWLSNKKLQRQFDLMESDSNVTFSSHSCRLHGQAGLGVEDYVKGIGVVDVTCNDVLDVVGQFAPTASYMIRRDFLKVLPAWFKDAPVGDFFIEMYGIAIGKGIHLNEPLSAYRTFSENSWSTQNNEKNGTKLVAYSERMACCLQQMKNDPLFRSCDFSRKFAASKFNVALGSLLQRDFCVYKLGIEECWHASPFMSVTQFVLYQLRGLPRFARLFYISKKRLLSA